MTAVRAYTVHAPPGAENRPERFAFIKDGMSWPALLVPLIWLLWHRMWLPLIGYLAYVLVLAGLGWFIGEANVTILAILGAILFALEANNVRRLSMRRRGWRDLGPTSGATIDEAELRFFGGRADRAARARLLPGERADDPARPQPDDEADHPHSDEPIFGLFPEPER